MTSSIVSLSAEIIPQLCATNGGNGWKNDRASWEHKLADQANGVRYTLVILNDSVPIGYGSLVWRSGYPPFAEASIPEISDVSVSADYRRRGFGRKLIEALEQYAVLAGHTTIGIGVGLYADYGSAQRLYIKLGYLPDGRGIAYTGSPVTPGDTVRIDDDACLFLTKML